MLKSKFREGESWESRHSRRQRNALKNKGLLSQWAKKNNYKLEIHNRTHFVILIENKPIAYWHPESGKAFINSDEPIKIHHTVDFINAIERLPKNILKIA